MFRHKYDENWVEMDACVQSALGYLNSFLSSICLKKLVTISVSLEIALIKK